MVGSSPPSAQFRLGALAGLYAIVGGAIMARLIFTSLAYAGLPIGLAVTAGLVVATAMRTRSYGVLSVLVAYSLAFALLTWPILALAGSAVWGKWE